MRAVLSTCRTIETQHSRSRSFFGKVRQLSKKDWIWFSGLNETSLKRCYQHVNGQAERAVSEVSNLVKKIRSRKIRRDGSNR